MTARRQPDPKPQHTLTPALEAELELRWRVRGKAHHVLADLEHRDVDWPTIADTLRSAVDAIETWAEEQM
jgi:hypothetical protein